MKRQSVRKLSITQVGISGEYFVAAELTRRGCIASLTLKNTAGVDILATSTDLSKSVSIQVKTSSKAKKDWMLSSKSDDTKDPSLFYIFVNLTTVDSLPAFHIVPSNVVASYTKRTHHAWLAKPGKRGQKHNDSKMRHFRDEQSAYLNKWELLGIF